MSRIYISPEDRRKWEERKSEWGESGSAHNISHTPVSVENRTIIEMNHKGFVPKNSTELQKKRTFVDNP